MKASSAAPKGTLFVVATPIGNLEDITLRALRVLKEADLIACEDTRQTQKLLSHYGIEKPTVSYHEHNEAERAAELVARLEQGEEVALVSDAGCQGYPTRDIVWWRWQWSAGSRWCRSQERWLLRRRWRQVDCPQMHSASTDFSRQSQDSGRKRWNRFGLPP